MRLSDGKIAAFRLRRGLVQPRGPRGSLVQAARGAGGLQAQVLSSADLAGWARVRGHRQGDLARALWEDRSLAKTWLMRGTLHLVPAEDLPIYTSALDARGSYPASWLHYWETTAAGMERLIDAIAEALDGAALDRRELEQAVRPRVGPQLSKFIGESWGGILKPAARRGVLCAGPTRGQNATFVRPDQWLGSWRELPFEEAGSELLRRYLSSYGPASRADFARWVGHGYEPRLRFAWEHVEVAEVEPKRFLLPEDVARLQAEPASRAVRLLPSFDPYLLSHQDREHLVDASIKDRVYRTAGWVSPVVLRRGRVAGVWSHVVRAGRVRVTVEPFQRLDAAARTTVEREAASVARFLGGELELSWRTATSTAMTGAY